MCFLVLLSSNFYSFCRRKISPDFSILVLVFSQKYEGILKYFTVISYLKPNLAKHYYGWSPVQLHHKYYGGNKKLWIGDFQPSKIQHCPLLLFCSSIQLTSRKQNRTETHDLLKQGILLVMGHQPSHTKKSTLWVGSKIVKGSTHAKKNH